MFFSYARNDQDDFLERFYGDLIGTLSKLSGKSESEIAFRDTTCINLGDRWSDELGAALARSKVLLCVCSPTYATRPWCGKEFAFFRQRVAAYQASRKLAQTPSLILPILWIPEQKGGGRLPDAIKELQWTEGFGKEYFERGLWGLTKLPNRYSEVYDDILHRIAKRILSVSDDHPLPDFEGSIDVAAIPDAFVPTTPGGAASPSSTAALAAPPPQRGPRRVQFILVAGRRGELAEARTNLDAYGEDPIDWRPYLPPHQEEWISLIAQGIAQEERLTAEFVPPTDDIIGRIERARRDNNLVVLIVDPWTLRIESYSALLKEYDRRDFLNCAVLVPWNQEDEETISSAEILRTAIFDTFENKAGAPDPRRFRDGIASLDQLKRDLRDALVNVRKRILEQAEVARRARAERVFVKPVISAVKST